MLQSFSLVTIYSLSPRGEHSKETEDKALLPTSCLVFILAATLAEACASQPHPTTRGCGWCLLHQAPRSSGVQHCPSTPELPFTCWSEQRPCSKGTSGCRAQPAEGLQSLTQHHPQATRAEEPIPAPPPPPSPPVRTA